MLFVSIPRLGVCQTWCLQWFGRGEPENNHPPHTPSAGPRNPAAPNITFQSSDLVSATVWAGGRVSRNSAPGFRRPSTGPRNPAAQIVCVLCLSLKAPQALIEGVVFVCTLPVHPAEVVNHPPAPEGFLGFSGGC